MFFSCHSVYIEKQSLNKNKKETQIFSSQYSLRMLSRKNYKKRTFYTSSCTREKASLTVEAAMVFPIFIFSVLFVIYGMKMIELQSKIQYALDVTALQMGSYALCAKTGSDDVISELATDIVYTKTGAKVMFLDRLNKCNGEFELINGAKNGFSLSKSQILNDDSEIYLVATYRIKLPEILGIKIHIPCVQNAYTRGFTGKTLKASKEDIIVYITTGQTVYHTNRQCTHLVLSIKKVENANVNKKKYSRCSICKNEKERSYVYITSEGTKYHKTLSCSSLKRTVQRITLSEANGRRVCKRCAG